MVLNCPRCEKILVQARFEGVSIDQCTGDPSSAGGCGGTWLDGGEIRLIQKSFAQQNANLPREAMISPTESVQSKKDQIIACPKCKEILVTYQFSGDSGVYVDRCKRCFGVWLDGNEIAAVQSFVLQTARRSLPAEDASASPGSARRCPRDGSILFHLEYEGESLDQCDQCKGIWCENSELGSIVNITEKQFREGDHPEISAAEGSAKVIPEMDLLADLCCVSCRAPMRRINYAYNSGIIIDRCAAGHGVWLDKDELERVQVYIERNRAAESSVRMKYAPVLERAAAEATKSYDERLKRAQKQSADPFFKVLSTRVSF